MSLGPAFDDVNAFVVGSEQIEPYVIGGPKELQALYMGLIKEEYKEFMDATEASNELQEAMDLIWVILGYAIMKGWDVPGAWRHLWLKNMAKLQKDPVTGQLLRRADGKILKPADWTAPDFTPFVKREE